MNHRIAPPGALLAALLVPAILVPAAAWAGVRLPVDGAPLPAARPQFLPDVDREPLTGSVVPLSANAAVPPAVDALRDGLGALSRGDLAAARIARDGLPPDVLARKVLAWAIAASENEGVASAEIADAEAQLSGWPVTSALRRNFERALAREAPAPEAVLAALSGSRPITVEGAVIAARAHLALGDADAARSLLVPFWRTGKLDGGREAAIIAEFGQLIPAAEHRFRMERMLFADRIGSAARVAALAGARELLAAWSAVSRNAAEAGRLLDAVPEAQRTPAFDFARARMLRRAGGLVEAAGILLAAPRDRTVLVDPDAWWIERRALSRELLETGRADLAYLVAAGHAAESPALAVDAEFHAGWYALRSLGDPGRAATHFARIAQLSTGAISQARAYYWLGRAAEAGGPGSARAFYAEAANHGTAFYGQLAAARLGTAARLADPPQATADDRRRFHGREAVRAIRLLERAGDQARAALLYRGLAEQLESPGELGLLASMAEESAGQFLALRIGKAAASRGLDVGALSHPLGAIPPDTGLSSAGMALALAIARQESEFNVGAVSGAGARGLLQLLPATARDMARKTGLPYSQARLTADPAYNATLGAAFLSEQLDRFDGSYVLTFAGYNAGPRRAREWAERYGDPRGLSAEDVVDWIERIPFTETRHYVQRVMENYQVYKMRLSGRMDIVADLTGGRDTRHGR